MNFTNGRHLCTPHLQREKTTEPLSASFSLLLPPYHGEPPSWCWTPHICFAYFWIAYKWNHTVRVALWPASFTQHLVHCCMKSWSVYFHCGKVFHCVKIPQFIVPFCCGWTFGWFPVRAVKFRMYIEFEESKRLRGRHVWINEILSNFWSMILKKKKKTSQIVNISLREVLYW